LIREITPVLISLPVKRCQLDLGVGAVVDIVQLNSNIFTYRLVSNGKTVTIEHVPM
jgi:hypothetical protein